MTDYEISQLAPSVREHFQDIKDATFDKHPEVIAARSALADATKFYDQSVSKVVDVKACIEKLELEQRDAKALVESTKVNRAERLADAFMAGGDLKSDRDLLAQQRDLEYLMLAIYDALPVIRQRMKVCCDSSGNHAQSVAGHEEHLRNVLDKLRLAEAERLAFA